MGTPLRREKGRSVKLLVAFASIVIPDFSYFEIHDHDFYSLKMGLLFEEGGASFSV
jgi:hypothetical protein